MDGFEIRAVFDLGGEVEPSAANLRDELLSKLRDENAKSFSYGFEHGGVKVHSILGELVRVEFSHYGTPRNEIWAAFEGLNTKMVEIKESGTDHFPVAGFYHGARSISGASATVRWALNHHYPLSEDVIGTVVQNSSSESSYGRKTIRLEVPVVYSRTWSLTLTAPTMERALKAYEQLRSGFWKPTTAFVDALHDTKKFRLLQQTVTTEDEE